MWSLPPLVREAAFWFCVGSSIALFMVALLVSLVAAAPGIESPATLARAVAKGVDSVIDTAKSRPAAPSDLSPTYLPPPREYRF